MSDDAPVEELPAEDLVTSDPYDRLEGKTPAEAVRSHVGGPNQYPYLDKTALPLHERDIPVNTSANSGPSQADLNPAFTPKPEDGGPSKERDGEQVIEGTEPNVNEQALAAAENSDDPDAVQAVEESIDAGQEQQMDAAQVEADAQARQAQIDADQGGSDPSPSEQTDAQQIAADADAAGGAE